jgi:biotin transport system permease protein
MLEYRPDETVAHRLDPRSKLCFQGGFAVAVFVHDSPVVLAGLTLLALGTLRAARLSPLRVVRAFRFVLVLLALGPFFAVIEFGPPWVVPERALGSVVAGYQVLLLLFVAGAYVRSTPVRESRAAIQRHVPGRFGQSLGVGVALVFRFTPVLRADLGRARDAIRARAGRSRSPTERVRRLAIMGVRKAFERADRLSLALRARCFAWNPTLPRLELSLSDLVVVEIGLLLAVSPLL